MKEYILTFPRLVKFKGASVLAHIVVPVSRERRGVLSLALPGIADVEIDRIAIAVKFPKARYRDLIPRTVIIGRSVEIHRTGIYILVPLEIPQPIEHQLHSVCLKIRRHRDTVPLHYLRILPVWQCFFWCCCIYSNSCPRRKSEESS